MFETWDLVPYLEILVKAFWSVVGIVVILAVIGIILNGSLGGRGGGGSDGHSGGGFMGRDS